MDELTIATLRGDEIEAAVALWDALRLTRPWNDARADARLALARPDATVLAGRIAGRLVATAMVGFDGHRAWVYYLGVAADCQHRGFGAAMMRAAEAFAVALGAPKIMMMVRGDNALALGFYQALGYERNDVAVVGRRLDGK